VFTSVATLQLIDRGLLALDTGVTDFLELEGTAISGDVNVFHLLTHHRVAGQWGARHGWGSGPFPPISVVIL
jgi:hypothetical protein